MPLFSRLQVATTMLETGIIPVFYHKDLTTCKNVLKACYDGGIRVFEFTNRGDFAHEVFRDLNKYASQELPGMIMGAGSVVEAGTTSLFIQLGAAFIVSPVLNEDMAKVCNRRKILWSPGCGSVSEISRAEELGAEIIKIFPGSQVGGPKFIEAVKGPMPWTHIMPTGGVDTSEENLKAWFQAGAACVGMGSQLFVKSWIESGDFGQITDTCKKVLEIAKKYKK
ncbi:MAG: bifunctional 4-hydroxy-2-oxoglutarate aldolase/2-dehydro-3-deoxy-phosphogluconate aldolase [Bacteroidales bacterium]|nr:bifunctional 4-hydroxy-2-oxoglutarate aldolase/2-dehydro-3-deoxy-phosphogluconate aldolase [Bacteroidales bacterium]